MQTIQQQQPAQDPAVVKDLRDRLSEAEDDLEIAAHDNETILQKLRGMDEELARSEWDRRDLEAANRELKRANRRLRDDVRDLRSEVRSLEERVSELDEDVADLEDEIDEMLDEVDSDSDSASSSDLEDSDGSQQTAKRRRVLDDSDSE